MSDSMLRFNDEQVQTRLALYKRELDAGAELKKVWARFGEQIKQGIREYWKPLLPKLEANQGPFAELSVEDFVETSAAQFCSGLD